MFSGLGNVSVCDPRTYYECLVIRLVDYVRDNEAANCNCPQQCRELVYEPTISQAPLSTSVAAVVPDDESNRSVEAIINDICVVEVSALNEYFTSSTKFTVCIAYRCRNAFSMNDDLSTTFCGKN